MKSNKIVSSEMLDQFDKIQISLQKSILQKNNFRWEELNFAAGVDLAYWSENDIEKAVCCIVVLELHSGKIIEQVNSMGQIMIPYLPGYLAFRELPLVIQTAEKLQCKPDIYIFDGNGYLHPRHMGIATHASFVLKKPTIGVAKSYYKIEGTEYEIPDDEVGAYKDIVIHGEVYGRVLRTQKKVKPIFISVGNYIDLANATKLTLNLVTKESHIPAPTRLADLYTHEMRTYYKERECCK